MSHGVQLPRNWRELRAGIIRESQELWATESPEEGPGKVIDAFAAMVSHSIEEPEIAGLADKVFNALGAMRDDEVHRKLAFERLCLSYEAYLKKLLCLTSDRSEYEAARNKPLFNALVSLELMSKEELKAPIEQLRGRRGHLYSIRKTYELRNQSAHFATDWSSTKVAQGIEHALVAYLQATRARFGHYEQRHPRAARLLSPLVQHEEHTRGFAGFLEFLLPASLPFVAPPEGHPAHPDRILATVAARGNQGGVLLVGAGGAGKTRTSLEVAALAIARGYRVMHALPGEPALTVGDLADAALDAGPNPILFVLDYLEHMPGLDLGAMRHRLLPELHQQGRRAAFLACSRPAWLLTEHGERDALFERVEVWADASRAVQVSGIIRQHVAPRAVRVLGDQQVAELTGQRPIIALLICRELEQRANDSALERLNRKDVPDLAAWLRRRLFEDGLLPTVPRATTAEGAFSRMVDSATNIPEPTVVAATAVLACAPLRRDELVTAAAFTLRALGRSEQLAPSIVAHLERLGWLEERDAGLAVAHDVVADEILDSVVWSTATGTLRVTVLTALLRGARDPRPLSRLAASLSRVIGATAPDKARALEQELHRWVVASASNLRSAFLDAHPDSASYTLGSLLSGPPLASPILEQWDQIVRPWLAANRHHVGARHLLYKGLRAGHGERLVPDALRWLEVHGTEASASFVLGPLLWLPEPPPEAVEAAIGWLETHGQLQEASWVLAPLLAGRSSIPSDVIARAFERWLAKHAATPAAASLLSRALSRPAPAARLLHLAVELTLSGLHGDAAGYHYVTVVRLHPTPMPPRLAVGALNWAESHDHETVQRILQELLRRDDVTPEIRSRAGALLLRSAATTLARPTTRFAVRALIEAQRDYSSALIDSREGIFTVATQWLEAHPAHVEADWIASRVLRSRSVSDDLWCRCAVTAIAWLDVNSRRDTVDFILTSLIRRVHLLSDAQCDRVLSELTSWAVSPYAQGANPVRSLELAATILGSGPHAAKVDRVEAALRVLQHDRLDGFAKRAFVGGLELDQPVDGVVKSVVHYGVFVTLGAGTLDALLHVSEIEDGPEGLRTEAFRQGDPISCRVLSVDSDRGRVQLTQRVQPALGTETTLDSMLSDAPLDVRALYRALGEYDKKEGRAAIDVLRREASEVPRLLAATHSRNAVLRRRAARTLAEMSPSDAAPALPRLRELLSDSNSNVKKDALRALGRHGDELAINRAQVAVFDINGWLRNAAAIVLRDDGEAETAAWVAQHLGDMHEAEQATLLPMLREHQPAIAAQHADALLQRSSNATAMVLSLEVLVTLSDPRAPDHGARLAGHRASNVRKMAVRALALAPELHLELLGRLAQDADAGVARSAQFTCAPYALDPRLAALAGQLGGAWASAAVEAAVRRANQKATAVDSALTGAAALGPPAVPAASLMPAIGGEPSVIKNGMVVTRRIKAIQPYGLFVNVAASTDALVHVSDIPVGAPVTERFIVGQWIEARVLFQDPDRRIINMGILQVEDDPWADPERRPRPAERTECTLVRASPPIGRVRGCYLVLHDLPPNTRAGKVLDVVIEGVDEDARTASARVVDAVGGRAPMKVDSSSSA